MYPTCTVPFLPLILSCSKLHSLIGANLGITIDTMKLYHREEYSLFFDDIIILILCALILVLLTSSMCIHSIHSVSA